MQKTKGDERQYLYVVKALALFSIVCAHTSVVPPAAGKWNILTGQILSSIGSVGVGIFLLLSAYFFYNNQKDFLGFWKGKLVTIFIPWIFCGTMDFLYGALRKDGLSFLNWFLSLICNSHLYFLTVLVVCYLVFFKLRFYDSALWVFALLSIVSIILTGLNVLKVNPYVNPFNWFLYFIWGLILRKNNGMERAVLLCKKWIWVFAFGYLLLLRIARIQNTTITYWSRTAILAELAAICLTFGIAWWIAQSRCSKGVAYIGKMSFSVYLVHMPFAGVITYFTSFWDCFALTLLRPFLVILSVLVSIFLYQKLAQLLHLRKPASLLIGARTDS